MKTLSTHTIRRHRLALIGLFGVWLLATPSLAQPDPVSQEDAGPAEFQRGVYLEGAGGSTRSLDQDSSFETALGNRSGDVDFKTGWQGGGAVGYRIHQVRFELAAQYATQQVEAFTFTSVVTPAGGDLDVITGHLNFYYDFDLGWPVRPFLGAGLGVARLDLNAEARPNLFIVDDEVNEIAWNAMLGLSMAVAPSTELFLRFRHVELFDEATFDASFPNISGDLDMDFSANEFGMGIRYTF